jgi:hypothetical protein
MNTNFCSVQSYGERVSRLLQYALKIQHERNIFPISQVFRKIFDATSISSL